MNLKVRAKLGLLTLLTSTAPHRDPVCCWELQAAPAPRALRLFVEEELGGWGGSYKGPLPPCWPSGGVGKASLPGGHPCAVRI